MGEMERRERGDEVEKRRRIGSTGGPGRGSQRQPGCGGEKGKKSRSRGVTRFTVYSMNSKVAWGWNWEWKRGRGRESEAEDPCRALACQAWAQGSGLVFSDCSGRNKRRREQG